MSAIEYWKNRVEKHHAQSIRAMGDSGPGADFWRPFAPGFRADPDRTDDPVLDRLRQAVKPGHTVLDVGGGAGRFALPLALICPSVAVVEPSESMLEQLREGAQGAGIQNVATVQGNWEDIEVATADVVLCSHVVYGVADIEPFIRKLDRHAKEQVLILSFMDSPQSHLTPFLNRVHGRERINLPALRELLRVLWEMEIYPDLEMFQVSDPQTFESREAAIEQLRQRLYVTPDTEEDRGLHTAADELLVETPDGLAIRGACPRRQGLISWRPA